MRKTGLVLALISGTPLAGCGGDEDTAAAEGLWALQRADGCAVLFSLREDGACAFGVACELERGDIGLERHVGTCELHDGELTATWEQSTCEGTGRLYGADYAVDGDRLVLGDESGRLVFERVESDGMGSASVTYGCWEGDTLAVRDLLPIE
jgi:hypothetical protein